jgi:pimeloyl-ACP methyl ester carboxylesterase
MKTRWDMCVFILPALLTGTLLLSAAGQQANAIVFGRAPSVPGSSSLLQANQPASTEPAQAANGQSITGEWQGMIAKQRLIVKIERAADGTFTAKLTAVDQGNVTLPVDTVSFEPTGGLRLELKSVGAVYEGKLSDDGSELVGTWRQGGASIPLTFRRPGAAPAKSTLKPRTLGSVSLEPCRTSDGNTEGLCGKYEVYENRQLKSGRKIALHIMLLPAMSAKSEPDPFFCLAGGPGQSATESFPLAGYVAKVRDLRDVVLVDQRGTGQSNPLQCSLQSLDNAQSVLGEPYSQEKIRECRKESDKKADTTQYTTSVAAADLDEVRQAMGYDKINLFGGSYGTKAALVYLRLHGDHVRTLTLEAVASPQFLIPLPFARGLQSSVDGVIALCAADAACRKDYPDLRNEFKTLVERLEKSPAQFQVNNQSVTLSREMFLSKLRGLLYIPQFVSAFPFIIHSAYQGDWSSYGGAALSFAGALEGAIARGASLAAICAEDVPALTEDAIRRETAGTYLGDSQVRRFKNYCEAWGRAGSIPKDFYSPVRSPAPTLLISGALDPATPPETAKQAAQYLVNSRLITVKEGTHGTGSPCLDGLVAEFVKRGSVTGLDASCADQIHLPPFLTKTANQGGK